MMDGLILGRGADKAGACAGLSAFCTARMLEETMVHNDVLTRGRELDTEIQKTFGLFHAPA